MQFASLRTLAGELGWASLRAGSGLCGVARRAVARIGDDPVGGVRVEDGAPGLGGVDVQSSEVRRVGPTRACADQRLVAAGEDENLSRQTIFALVRLRARLGDDEDLPLAAWHRLGRRGKSRTIRQSRFTVDVHLLKAAASVVVRGDVPAPDIVAAEIDVVEVLFDPGSGRMQLQRAATLIHKGGPHHLPRRAHRVVLLDQRLHVVKADHALVPKQRGPLCGTLASGGGHKCKRQKARPASVQSASCKSKLQPRTLKWPLTLAPARFRILQSRDVGLLPSGYMTKADGLTTLVLTASPTKIAGASL